MKEVIGNGDVAQALERTDKDVLFFASGVSNSQETREEEYQREKELLLSQPRDRRLVYFGSLSIFHKESRYTQHKLEMEELVRDEFPQYTIVRLGTIDWGDNPHTIINHFRGQLEKGEPLEIRDTSRYVTNQDEFLHWVNLIPDTFNCEMNITGQPMEIKDIVKEYVL